MTHFRMRLASVTLALSTAIALGTVASASATADAGAAARPLVRFTNTDGFTYGDTLLIRADRTVVVTYDRRGPGPRKHATRRFRLAASTAERVRQLLRAARFATLGAPIPIDSKAPISRSIRSPTGEDGRHAAIQRVAVPKRLVRLIRALERILAARAPR